jgi:hypothetical protein
LSLLLLCLPSMLPLSHPTPTVFLTPPSYLLLHFLPSSLLRLFLLLLLSYFSPTFPTFLPLSSFLSNYFPHFLPSLTLFLFPPTIHLCPLHLLPSLKYLPFSLTSLPSLLPLSLPSYLSPFSPLSLLLSSFSPPSYLSPFSLFLPSLSLSFL